MSTRGNIVLRLDRADQLVKPSTASPFPRRRLQEEAEDFIIERASGLTGTMTFAISLPGMHASTADDIREAIREHFAVRRKEAQKKLGGVRKLGWRTLGIGLVFLSVTIVLVEIMKHSLPAGNLATIVEQGLTVLAWVALWKPGELLLYEWIPFRRDARLFGRLENADVVFNGHAATGGE